MIDEGRVVHEVHYAHSVEDVWRALTEPSELAAWLMPNDFVPEVGHRFRFDARPTFDVIEGEVLEVDPPRLLRCRWVVDGAPTIVTMHVRGDGDGDGTFLRLEHEALTPALRAEFDGGWDSKLRSNLPVVLDHLSGEP